MQEFFKNLRDMLFPAPKKKTCPYCGGGKCFGLCGMVSEQASAPTEAEKLDNAKAREDSPAG